MGVIANEVLAGGGRVIGVIPELLQKKEQAHRGLTELHLVQNMHCLLYTSGHMKLLIAGPVTDCVTGRPGSR